MYCGSIPEQQLPHLSKNSYLLKKTVTRRRFLKIAGVGAGALSLSHLEFFGQQATFIQIGALLPLTGGLSDLGPRLQAAAQLAIDDMNAVGGPGNFRLGLVVRDDATSDEATATVAALQLVSSGVQAIFGPAASSNVLAASDVTVPNKVVLVSPCASSPAISALRDDGYVFRMAPSDAFQGSVLADTAFNVLGYRKIAIIARNDPYGAGLAAELSSDFESLGGTVTSTSLYSLDTTDFSTQIAAAKAGNPDAISLIAFDEGETLIEQMVAAGVNNFDLFSDGLMSEDLFDRLASKVGPDLLSGKFGTATGAPLDTEGYQSFAAKYRNGLHEDPITCVANAYDALAVLGLAIHKAALLNGGKLPTGTEIRDQMREVANPPGEVVTVGEFAKAFDILNKGGKINYEGASGSVDFDANGGVDEGVIGLWLTTLGNSAAGQSVQPVPAALSILPIVVFFVVMFIVTSTLGQGSEKKEKVKPAPPPPKSCRLTCGEAYVEALKKCNGDKKCEVQAKAQLDNCTAKCP
jgi:ABC-type branched-subunit amino acid transport system substrate-binding protein